MGGARADFVAMLGRRVADLGALSDELEADPMARRLRDDVRRRVHALAAGAKLLKFSALGERLAGIEAMLDMAALRGEVIAKDLAELRAALAELPELAWGKTSVGTASTPPPPRAGDEEGAPSTAMLGPVSLSVGAGATDVAPPPIPQTVLVVGGAPLAATFLPPGEGGAFEVEHTEDTGSALDLARALAPDAMIIDADRPGARQLCDALTADPLTENIPILALGSWSKPEEAGAFVALGVARALPKPVSPDQLRRAAAEVTSAYVRREEKRPPLGSLSIDDLGQRLAEELRRGLCDAAAASGRETSFDLGEGTDVMAALWGAVARIRDIVTIHSSGQVRFSPTGPEGALPIAPWIGAASETPGDARQVQQASARTGLSRLDRKVVVVADDDPAVTWFLAGVLRAAGAVVHEAHDGARALEVAFRVSPDLLISDVLMPKLDGFELCRAMKRDLVLGDVPVILLSWKEDLLQRVRELGADAAGYLRKEASAAVIVQRVREVMRPRQRVADRLATTGEVRGRLDGLTTRTLLALTCELKPNSTLSVRDSAFLYEIEIRKGQPVRAVRTTPEGSFERASGALLGLLGVGAGRFVVTPCLRPVTAELEGTLAEQLLPRVCSARAAQHLLSGTRLVGVELVELDEDRMAGYVTATPEPARSLLRTVAAGASPRALITSGQASARLVEDVLCDAAAHGAILAIAGADGVDLLDEATARELRVARGVPNKPAPLPEPILDLGPIMKTATPAPVEVRPEEPFPLAVDEPYEDEEEAAPSEPAIEATLEPVGEARVASEWEPDVDGVPTAPAPEVDLYVETPHFTPRPVAAPIPSPTSWRALAARLSGMKKTPAAVRAQLLPPAPPAVIETPAPALPPAALNPPGPLLTLGSLSPPPVAPAKAPVTKAEPPARTPTPAPAGDELTPSRSVRKPSSFLPDPRGRRAADVMGAPPPPKAAEPGKSNRTMWGLFAVAGIVFAIGARIARDREVASHAPAAAPVAETAAPAAAPAPNAANASQNATPAEPEAVVRGEGETKNDPILPVDAPLRADDKVPPGQGMLEVVAGTSDQIFIDGTLVGNGPIVKRALAPKKEPYEIRVKVRGEERVRFAKVTDAHLTRLRIAPPWSR